MSYTSAKNGFMADLQEDGRGQKNFFSNMALLSVMEHFLSVKVEILLVISLCHFGKVNWLFSFVLLLIKTCVEHIVLGAKIRFTTATSVLDKNGEEQNIT